MFHTIQEISNYLYPKNYTFRDTVQFGEKYEWLWVYSFLFYLPICQILQSCHIPSLRNTIKYVGFFWNIGLTIFSLIGTLFTLPFLIKCLYKDGLDSVLLLNNPVCDFREIPSVSFWCSIFVYSKIPELIDTFLYILKNGKQHIFLHWYHHMFTGVYSYMLVRREQFNRLGIWMVALNFFVHTFMYAYYAVMEITEKDSSIRKIVMKNASFITMIQLSQMIIVCYVLMHDWIVLGNELDHFGLGMYLVYAVLFGKLFLEKYITHKNKSH